MKFLMCIAVLVCVLPKAFARDYESFEFENKGSASATYIMSNSSLPVGIKIEGDAAKAMYAKFSSNALCVGEDATAGQCVQSGENVNCTKSYNSRGDFYSCSFDIDEKGKTSPASY
jgi:hypothetical protein